MINYTQYTPENLNILNNHPAITGSTNDFMSIGAFWISSCSVEGHDEQGPITLYRTNEKDFQRFKRKFGKDRDTIYVSYKEYYGYEWEYDHTEYSVDVPFTVFIGDFDKRSDIYDSHCWQSYNGFWVNEKSFDELILVCRLKVQDLFGKFNKSFDQMKTPGEIKNNKEEECFFHKKIKNKPLHEMIINDKFMHVNAPIHNRRWLRWFITTDYCKKTWKGEFNKLVKNTPEWVWDLSKR